jgi:hypothetical protein
VGQPAAILPLKPDGESARWWGARYGGKKQSSVNKSTSYVVLGRDPGEKKVEKMEALGIKHIDEVCSLPSRDRHSLPFFSKGFRSAPSIFFFPSKAVRAFALW